MSLLEIKHIKKRFGDLEVLKDISLKVDEGEVLAIIGPSGSGKSTLLSVLSGVLSADSGLFSYNGCNLFADSKIRTDIIGCHP